MAQVREINRLDELPRYQAVWNELARQTSRASFFHTYEWFVTFWKHFGHNRRMRILIVESDNRVMGIVPLCVIEEAHRLSTIRVLTYPLSDWGMWFGPIGPNPSATMFMALRHLRDTPRDWEVIDLRWTEIDLHHPDVTGRALSAVGWKPRLGNYQQTSLVHFANTTWEGYFQSLDKKWRHEIRRQGRNLEKLGPVEFIRHRPEASENANPRWDLFEACVEVSRNSWQADSTNGNTLCHEEVLPFLRDCHAAAARLGMVDMVLVRVAGETLAFQYNYYAAGKIFGLRMGYDRRARDLGVGKVLLSRLIQDSFERGDLELDLGIGEFDFKSRFRTGIETSYNYTYSPWTSWRSHGVRMSQWIRRQVAGEAVKSGKPVVAT